MLSNITYKQFNKIVRKSVNEANPDVSGLQVTSLVGAKWREFKELYGMDSRSDTPDLERLKSKAVPSPSSEKGSMVRLDFKNVYYHGNVTLIKLQVGSRK
jgi:CHDNT (NUC034) domain.